MKKYDAIIIGSGQAGTPLVFRLAKEGMNVAFIEKEYFGGTCLNVGCTPTKTYVASARRMWDANHGEELGIDIPHGAKPNMKKVKARKDEIIKKSVDGIAKAVENGKNITFYKGTAQFEDKKVVSVNDEQLTAPEIYINVGGRPFIPSQYEGLPYLTNESILQLEEVPDHLVIIGGSYIGLEFGQMFRRFGSEVTIIEKGPRIIHREDKETSDAVLEFLKKEGINFELNAECMSGILNEDETITIKMECPDRNPIEYKSKHVLFAIGRKPNTDALQLDKAGIESNNRGYIKVNDVLETNVKGVYALGDCNGEGSFTHTAYNDFEIIAENKFDGKSRKVSDRILTYGLFVDPPLGRVGMTKKEAREKGYDILVGHRPMSKISRAKEKGETEGFMSIVIDANTERILGATILGTGGDEIIGSITNIMYAKGSYKIIRDSIQAHPTVSELIPTMLEGVKKDEE